MGKGSRLKAKRKGRRRLPALASNRWERSERGRGATGRKTIISGRRDDQGRNGWQFDTNAAGDHQHNRRRAAQQVALGQERDEAFMAGALGIVVEQVMKTRRQADQNRDQPEQQHQAHYGLPARRVRLLICSSRLQATTIKQQIEALARASSFRA